MTEPDAGTDVANYQTNVDHVGNRLRLNGVKTLISRAEEAGMFVVFTRIDKKPGREGIGCVLVEKGTPGFSVTGTYHTMGGENLHEIRFEDCELPPENLVLEDGFRKLLSAFNTQRCLNPSISLGLAEGALEEAVKYAKERKAFGRAIADFQGMRWKIAEMYRDIEASRSDPLPRLRHRRPVPRPAAGRRRQDHLSTRWRCGSPARRSRCMAATASPTSSRCRASTAAPATAPWAAAPRKPCAT